MRKKILFVLFLYTVCLAMEAAPFKFLATTVTQPDGSSLELFASGDEFYHWIHDANGYTIVQGEDGYCYYAVKGADNKLVASSFRADRPLPSNAGISPWLRISREDYRKKADMYQVREKPLLSKRSVSTRSMVHEGSINNIVIYVSFKDATTFLKDRGVYDKRFNGMDGKESFKGYYNEVSYGKLDIESHHFPGAEMNSKVMGYVDFLNRGFYKPHSATNADGYTTEDERTAREHNLLVNAIDGVRDEIGKTLSPDDIDKDGDGYVDNICFIIQGNSDGWSDLLWAHRWSLYTRDCTLLGKKVWDYVFQPENQVTVNTLCHEMFHALGAPDLYHYDEKYEHLEPVGDWGLMASGWVHMGAYMKWRYGDSKWITEMPEIKSSGRYYLNPLKDGPDNVCYKVSSTNPDEFYVLEYRKKDGLYEKNIPQDGLLIYRINMKIAEGNRNGPPDEVYIYRPYGSLTENGDILFASYQSYDGAAISDKTFPTPFLSDGSDGGLRVKNVKEEENRIGFDVQISGILGNEHLEANNVPDISMTDNILSVSGEQIKQIAIINMSGQTICEDVKANTTEDLTSLPSGFYIVRVLYGDQSCVKKIQIK